MLNRIVEYRKARGLTQRDLARAWGVTQSTLSKLESGHQGLGSQEAIRVAAKSGLPPETFLVRYVSRRRSPSSRKRRT